MRARLVKESLNEEISLFATYVIAFFLMKFVEILLHKRTRRNDILQNIYSDLKISLRKKSQIVFEETSDYYSFMYKNTLSDSYSSIVIYKDTKDIYQVRKGEQSKEKYAEEVHVTTLSDKEYSQLLDIIRKLKKKDVKDIPFDDFDKKIGFGNLRYLKPYIR